MKLGFIGLGNMGRAICSGLVHKSAIAAQDVFGYAPHADKLNAYAAETGIHACTSAQAVCEAADAVIIAVKPNIIVMRCAARRWFPWRWATILNG